MANPSILAAFERMWQHTIAKIGQKADVDHDHDEYLKANDIANKADKSYVDEQLDDKADSSHEHSASNITSGTLSSNILPTVPMSKGGTGATDGATGLANLFAAGNTVLSSYQYGTELPDNPAVGQVYFEEATGTIADIGQDVAKALRAVNLLINSDFANPVNQKGASSYKGAVECIDKWNISSVAWMVTVDDGFITVSDNPDSTSTATGMLQQTVPVNANLKGKTVTFAAKVKGSDIRLNINNTGIGLYSTDNNWNIMTVTGVVPEDADTFFVALQSRNQTTYSCEWVALYEGEFTAETLPPYAPKEYEVERLSCNGGASNSFKGVLTYSGWSSSAPYTQSITVNGLLATDEPFVDIDLSDVADSNVLYALDDYSLVGRITVSADNTLTAYCYEEKPTGHIPIMLKVVR